MTIAEKKALKTLDHAFEHIRPRMLASQTRKPNAESLAGSVLADLMCKVVEASATEQSAKVHTPGPWKVMSESLHFPKLLVRAPQTDKAIADCDFQNGAEGEANARLVAAAPDLLAACEAAERNLASLYASGHHVMRLLRTALAKVGA